MKTPLRASTEQNRLALKSSLHLLIQQHGGGDCAQHFTRVGAPQLSRYHSTAEDDCHAPIDVVLDLELAAGHPIVTQTLARMQGFRLVRGRLAADGTLGPDHVVDVVREGTDVYRVLAQALADGEITRTESRKIKREIHELGRVLEGVLLRLPGECGR